MNIYGPHRYNKETGKYEPELYPTIADMVLTVDGKTVMEELYAIRTRFNNIEDSLKKLSDADTDLQIALSGITPDTLIIQSSVPLGDEKRLWIKSDTSVAYYFDGVNWKPVAGTAV